MHGEQHIFPLTSCVLSDVGEREEIDHFVLCIRPLIDKHHFWGPIQEEG